MLKEDIVNIALAITITERNVKLHKFTFVSYPTDVLQKSVEIWVELSNLMVGIKNVIKDIRDLICEFCIHQ